VLFHTQLYLAFFVTVFVVYWAMPWAHARIYWLLGASILFYASWNEELALLVTTTATLDYLLGRGIAAAKSRRQARLLVAFSLVMNLGILCYFKYVNFFLESLQATLALVGIQTGTYVLDVIVPFGISFYTFEAISYTIDVYQGRVRAERSLPRFLLFILFFPHLVAGPIVRGKDFLTQAARPKSWSWVRGQHGLQLIVLGLFKKLAIADCMAIYSERVFKPDQDISGLSSGAVWMAVLAFSIQIYCDFSGYSDMALGSAHLLGYKLTVNFRMPYFAPNIALFWRRWHISLSNWLRDYLFIPLGGSRHGEWRTYRNLLITMSLGGLWHGANASFVVWGILHGLLLIGHRLLRRVATLLPTMQRVLDSIVGKLLGMATTFLCVTMCWVFFQPSLAKAVAVFERMFAFVKTGSGLPMDQNRLWWTALLIIAAHTVATLGWWKRLWLRLPAPIVGVACAFVFVLAQLLSTDTTKAFVYFQF
jgi:alginate O-acetyltransferase complex protein AlgI